jgi:hypothetical protein
MPFSLSPRLSSRLPSPCHPDIPSCHPERSRGIS